MIQPALAANEQLVDKVAPVHVLHFMVKVAENNLVHTAELLISSVRYAFAVSSGT